MIRFRFERRSHRVVDKFLSVGSLALICATGLTFVTPLHASEETVRFQRDVLPILADHCFPCHGFDAGQREAGLRFDLRESATEALDSGSTAIVPGDLKKSELWNRITSADPGSVMPPLESGATLTNVQKETLRQWIEAGAPYESHWAFLAPQRKPPPDVAGTDHPIDCFVRDRLHREGLTSSPPADRATFIRRVTLDLTGLPPTPQEVEFFLEDSRPDAFEQLVDRLLHSPHFGEHWGRWWLDLAHYADSDGYLQDFLRPVAWRYRQWVVDALNRDQPFDQFTIEQLAGDLLPEATIRQRMGTGFLRNTLSNREGGAGLEEFRVAQVLDRTATMGTTWLGLTIACAQCHDHKFDPITQREFYQLYAFFNQAEEANFDAPLAGEREAWDKAIETYSERRAEILAPVAKPLAELQADWERRLLHAEENPNRDFAWDRTLELLGLQWGQNLGEGQLEGLNIIKTPLDQRTEDQQARLLDYFLQTAPPQYSEQLKELGHEEIRTRLADLKQSLPPVTRAPAMMKSPVNRTTFIHLRGDHQRPGEQVTAGTPEVLPELMADGDVDRLALAQWLVSPDHPLTSRVIVNRVWQQLFGRGIVATSDNFGVRGAPPEHPELLDWLAVELVDRQWSLKALIKQIVMSDTYRQSSHADQELLTRDPLNRLLARQSRLRLSAESIRDSSLATSGMLVPKIGGPSVKPPQPDSVSKEGYRNTWEPSVGGDRYRRGLYTFIQRTSPFAQFVTFDLPDTSQSCTVRERSNTPLQALNLLNDPTFLEAAKGLAIRVLREGPEDDAGRIEYAYRITLGRAPLPAERDRLLAYLAEQREIFAVDASSEQQLVSDSSPDTEAAWITLASLLLNLDEFITRE